MKALLEMLQLADINDLEREADLLERDLSHVLNLPRNQENPVSKFPEEELNFKMEEAIKRLAAARTGLGLTNKLRNPEDKKKNRSRIMKNLNLLRLIVQDVEEKLGVENQAVLGNNGNNGNNVREDVEHSGKSGIKKDLVKAVKDEGTAKKELGKNPFNKNKKVKAKKVKLPKEPKYHGFK